MKNLQYWLPRGLAAVILLQTLYFKFSAAPESVYIFSKIGLEPYGRIGIGCLELVASLLIMYRKTSWTGALLSIGLMFGAVASHLGPLGIEVLNDGGKLFILALIVLASSVVVLWQEKQALLDLFAKLKSTK